MSDSYEFATHRPKITRFRYFGTHTTWYLQYHRTWDWLCHSRMTVSFLNWGVHVWRPSHIFRPTPTTVEPLRVSPPEAVAYLFELQRLGESLALGLAQSSAAAAIDELRREAETLRRKKADCEKVISARDQTGERAQNVIEALREAASAVVKERLREIGPLLQSIYARIDPHPSFGFVTFLSRVVRGKGELHTVVRDPLAEKECDFPAAVLSSSQVNALAVSVFLTLNIGVPKLPLSVAMRVSHEAIYQALYIQGRGALRRELTACLRTGRALRVPRARRRGRGKEFVGPDIMISERPAEAENRAIPGHWEGDLIIGLDSSAIGTLVERTTRFTMLLHLPRMAERGRLRVKNGPALAGHGAEAVRDAITSTIATLPDQLRRSLTWDQGAEMAQHAQLRIDTGLHVFFCDPRSPWQRGTNENTNGLLRQYFPKGTDLNRHSASDIAAVATTLNRRPRKTLGWRTPSEAFNELLLSHQRGRVATTP